MASAGIGTAGIALANEPAAPDQFAPVMTAPSVTYVLAAATGAPYVAQRVALEPERLVPAPMMTAPSVTYVLASAGDIPTSASGRTAPAGVVLVEATAAREAAQSVEPQATEPIDSGQRQSLLERPDVLALKADERIAVERPSTEPVPAFVLGLKISGETGKLTVIEGEAELRKRGTNIKADRIIYQAVEDQLAAQGNVRVYKQGDLFTGTALDLKLDAQTGVFLKAEYLLANNRARGSAERLEFLGNDRYRADDAVYTTCGPGNDDWYLQVKELKLDYGRDIGEVDEAKLMFKGMNILSVPGMSFALNSKRKSGFLTPSFGSTIQSGQELSVPYYLNIAPNRDLTITPRFMTKRGLQTSFNARYIGEGYQGEGRLEWLPEDRITKTNRNGFSLLHRQSYGGWAGLLNVNKVSDSDYFTDLSSRITATSQRTLAREGSVTYSAPYYNFGARIQSFQALQDPLNPIATPYHRVPQLTLNSRTFDAGGFDINVANEFTRFTHPSLVMGNRLVVNPSVSYPLLSAGAFLTPKLSLHTTKYFLQQNAAGTPDGFTRTVSSFSLDGGLVFERPTSLLGQNYTQTLEPRVMYLRVPDREQTRIPVFDSGLPDLNFAQIFSENLYSGQDRIADANQITFGVTSRFIGTDKLNERLRFALAQRYYFTDQTVTLPGETPRTDRTSDTLASVSGEIVPKLILETALQYNGNQREVRRVSHGVRWSPEPGKTLSAAYRYRRDLLEQVDVAGQWKFASQWSGVARYNYSLRDNKLVEALAGVEYDGECWVGRVVFQRFATSTQRASTSIFFQIELNGLSRLGSNPIDALRRNIPGYTKLNENQLPAPRTMDRYE